MGSTHDSCLNSSTCVVKLVIVMETKLRTTRNSRRVKNCQQPLKGFDEKIRKQGTQDNASTVCSEIASVSEHISKVVEKDQVKKTNQIKENATLESQSLKRKSKESNVNSDAVNKKMRNLEKKYALCEISIKIERW